MARIELAPEVRDDLARTVDHLLLHEAHDAAARARGIIDAINVLHSNPLIGRPSGSDEHELVIGRGAHGYVALYRYVAVLDTVFVLAVRGQREAGYARP